jgi:hypothetical protein
MQSYKEKVLSKEIVFKCSMQSDFQNIKELKIIKEQITKIENGNQMFKLMGASLRKLDLSLNLLKYFENFELL